MKIISVMKIRNLLLAALFIGTAAHADVMTQVSNGGYPSFLADSNWEGGAAPESGVDSAVLNSHNSLNSGSGTWVLGAGQTMTIASGTTSTFYVDPGYGLTLASGSSLNFVDTPTSGMRLSLKGDLRLEAGSSISTDRFVVDGSDGRTVTWVADSSGVANVSSRSSTLSGTAIFDLSLYDLGANGSTMAFMTTSESGTFDAVQILGGFTADVDYGFNGNTQIALTNIEAIPEPATLGLIASFGAGLLFIRRKFLM